MYQIVATLKHRHGIYDVMKTTSRGYKRWTRSALMFLLVFSFIGYVYPQTHTRHPHTSSAHRRSIRADIRTNLSHDIEETEYKQIYSKQGDQLVLNCAVNINFSTSIWLKDGQIVQTILKDNTNNKRVIGHRFLVDVNGNLLIDNVRLEDDGRWQCEAEDAFGFVVQGRPIQLTILDPPKKAYLMIDNRILDPGNLFILVKENSDLTVSCVVDEGNPKPQLSWELTLGSSALLEIPEVPLEVLNLTETVRDQKFGARTDARLGRVLRGHHNATLTCYVRHIALDKPLNASVLLDVEYTPSFAISREPGFGFPIREGMPVSLKCDVDANPKAQPIWQKDDVLPPVQQTLDGMLNFSEIRREHSGWYKCIAKHRLGRFSSIGYFLNVRYDTDVTQEPEFDIGELSSTGKQLEVSLGGAVQLACPPGTTGCWTRVEPATGMLEPLGASQELRLDNVIYQEGGEYRCVGPTKEATKRLDSLRNSMSIQVVVSGQPTIAPTNKSITALYGQPLTMTMEFCANPTYTKAFWIAKDVKIYKPGDGDTTTMAYGITNLSQPNCHQAVLFLTKVTALDIGEYNFIVKSPNGIADGSFHVNMSYASGYKIELEENVKIENNYTNRIFTSFYINVICLLIHIIAVND
ncbi:titin [Diorhabda carinulata]|uniref:titin n=1 Tax=Diorhabda carinulata TaxID=1163345 RepID=UPI0025A29DCB|nr:titin [Diorhabda carinulata]XP_057653911.1 titin [Diorhabda carinulata]XP_057653912.1 titin [Diorhabda carinulata]